MSVRCEAASIRSESIVAYKSKALAPSNCVERMPKPGQGISEIRVWKGLTGDLQSDSSDLHGTERLVGYGLLTFL